MAQVQEGLLILCRIAAFIAISPVFSEKISRKSLKLA